MGAKEKTELADYLKKEATRLSKAVAKAEKEGRYGRVANLRTSLNAYQKFLECIYKDFKRPLLFVVAFTLTILTWLTSAEAQQTSALVNKLLEGKTFDIKFTGGQVSATEAAEGLFRFSFKSGKVYFSQQNTDYYHFFKFSPSFFYAMIDSTQGGMILFSSESKNKKGETLLWLGSVLENTISGTMIFLDQEKCKLFRFSGTMRYVNSSEGKF